MAPKQQNKTASPCAAMGVRAPTSRCLVDEDRIAVEESSGDSNGQPVVCLHDVGSGSREFRPLQNRPPAGSRLILFDWPGHGRSESLQKPIDYTGNISLARCAAVLHAVLNQLGIARPILVGSGFGAAVGLRYAARHQARILGLALCQPAGLIPAAKAARQSLPKTCHPGTSATPEIDAAAARRQALRLETLIPRMAAQRALAEASLTQSQDSLRTALQSLSMPILFALSRDSKAYPLRKYLSLLDPLLAKASQHRLTVFAGGFSPIWDGPARFAQALNGFIQAQLPFQKHSHAWLLTAVDWPTRDTNLWKCVHPECPEELVLPAGQNANDIQPQT